MDFGSLQHMKNRRSTVSRARPPATFHLQGLVTLLAAYSLRLRAGSISHRRRSWDSPFGVFSFRKAPGFFRSEFTHLPFAPPLFLPSQRQAGSMRCGSWALILPRSTWQSNDCSDRRSPATPLGSALLGYADKDPGRDLAQPPLTRFTS